MFRRAFATKLYSPRMGAPFGGGIAPPRNAATMALRSRVPRRRFWSTPVMRGKANRTPEPVDPVLAASSTSEISSHPDSLSHKIMLFTKCAAIVSWGLATVMAAGFIGGFVVTMTAESACELKQRFDKHRAKRAKGKATKARVLRSEALERQIEQDEGDIERSGGYNAWTGYPETYYFLKEWRKCGRRVPWDTWCRIHGRFDMMLRNRKGEAAPVPFWSLVERFRRYREERAQRKADEEWVRKVEAWKPQIEQDREDLERYWGTIDRSRKDWKLREEWERCGRPIPWDKWCMVHWRFHLVIRDLKIGDMINY